MKRDILVVDIGNTSAHIALCAASGRVKKEFRIPTPEISARAFAVLRKNISLKNKPVVVAASVVPTATAQLEKVCARAGFSFLAVGKDLPVPIANRYQNPKQVGIDRLLNAYAGYAAYQKSLIIIDFGTAITLDLVSKKGEYLGGIIAPGIEISLEALFQKTALLPRIRLEHPPSLIGRNTVESIRVGCSVGIGGLCDRLVERLRATHLPGAKVLATGGYARFMKRYCHSIGPIDDRLVLKGILGSYLAFLRK